MPGFLYLDRVLTAITVQDTGAGPGVGFSFDDVISLHGEILLPLTATVGTPLTLNLVLSINSFASGGFSAGAFGSIDALHTFGVPQGGQAVFDLPEGYTAESRSLNIVNNVVPVARQPGPAGNGPGFAGRDAEALRVCPGYRTLNQQSQPPSCPRMT